MTYHRTIIRVVLTDLGAISDIYNEIVLHPSGNMHQSHIVTVHAFCCTFITGFHAQNLL